MKNKSNLFLLFSLSCGVAHGTIVSDAFSYLLDEVPTVSSTDLLQTSVASSTNTQIGADEGFYYHSGPLGAVAILNDGAADPAAGEETPNSILGGNERVWVDGIILTTITYNFDLSINFSGYDISTIATYNEWPGNRHYQQYTIWYSTVEAPDTFIIFQQVDYRFSDYVAHAVVSYDDATEFMLTNVAAIKFDFTQHPNGTGILNGSNAYSELDVIGVASAIPETSTALLALGSVGFTIVRRRR